VGLEGENVALLDRCALDQRPAVNNVTDSQITVALFSAEGVPGHAQDQALLGLLTPQCRSTCTVMPAADRAWIQPVGSMPP
jgi:hypothetical protein